MTSYATFATASAICLVALLLLQLGTVGQVDLLSGAEATDVRIFERGVVARIDFG